MGLEIDFYECVGSVVKGVRDKVSKHIFAHNFFNI